MKAKLNIYTFILILILFSFADLAIGQECNYDSTDLNITLNGWDISRTDYTHQKFIEVAGLEQNSQLEYSGEKDTEEFGYPWYYYGLGNNYIHFAGQQNSSGYFNGQKRMFSFKIKKRGLLNVNGIQVGDTVNDLKAHFNHFDFCTKTNEGEKSFILRYSYQSLIFEISPQGKIKEIELYSPL